jgi:hypothetical protein
MYKTDQGRQSVGLIDQVLSHTHTAPAGREITQKFLLVTEYSHLSQANGAHDIYSKVPSSGCLVYN